MIPALKPNRWQGALLPRVSRPPQFVTQIALITSCNRLHEVQQRCGAMAISILRLGACLAVIDFGRGVKALDGCKPYRQALTLKAGPFSHAALTSCRGFLSVMRRLCQNVTTVVNACVTRHAIPL